MKWTPASFKDYKNAEHDACGVVSAMEKRQIPTKANIDLVIASLKKMDHRAGFINGEGDGIGIHIDIPRALWEEKAGIGPSDKNLVVGHFFIREERLKAHILTTLVAKGFEVLFESDQESDPSVLGPFGKLDKAVFYQVALRAAKDGSVDLNRVLFDATIELEQEEQLHVASLSKDYAVYKVLGAGETLLGYYKDLQNPLIASTMTLGHNRFSTNTLSNFFRVQPFSLIGHNGEINTVDKLRSQARMIGAPLVTGGSDSQDLNRTLETLVVKYGFSLFEALDIVFPPILNEIMHYEPHKQDLYAYLREAWGHFAQGPAGIISRFEDEAVFSVDALGLRPLWKTETKTSYIFASEPGVVHPFDYVAEPKPLAPGEKVGLKYKDGELEYFDYLKLQDTVYERISGKLPIQNTRVNLAVPSVEALPKKDHPELSYPLFGWGKEHLAAVKAMADKGAEPIRSLGYDAPLAALSPKGKNVADFLKETIAVVTNPAIDRDREVEHFSIRTVIGKRPSLEATMEKPLVVELPTPILTDEPLDGIESLSFEQLIGIFEGKTQLLDFSMPVDSTLKETIEGVAQQAVAAVKNGAELLVFVDDNLATDGYLWTDAHVMVSAAHQALSEAGLRREASIIVRSGSIRNLHDIMTLYGLGADAVNPYLMFEAAKDGKKNLYDALSKGVEKVISTMGIHELRGYGHLFSAIGLHEEIASLLGVINFFGSEEATYSLAYLEEEARRRELEKEAPLPVEPRILMKVWKGIHKVAQSGDYAEYGESLREVEEKQPYSIRHLLDFKKAENPAPAASIKTGEHDLPFVISSMSFGSQNETAFRAYAEAAHNLNMISLNGEGGEIKDMLGKYLNTRGIQVASGRFGVNSQLLNGARLIELKIGQGAKPGEGGHLPGSKVTEKIAQARNAAIGSDLISPSNNHDIYSIEDLAQVITEFKTINQLARIAVKIPIVPNIGTIAVGVAKAGADIINISGFDGGTGAARIHAIQFAGLPVEIGVKAAHNALIEAGMRQEVELWADGGMRSAEDALKVMLLGANRIGFGTLSMIAVGCTTCRGCHLDTCHVGIATQVQTPEQAKAHGIKRFVPREYEPSVQRLMTFFGAFGDRLRQLTAELGFDDLQSIVGRSDLLVQLKGQQNLNLQTLLTAFEAPAQPELKEAVVYQKVETVGNLEGAGIDQRVLGGNENFARTYEAMYHKTPQKHLELVYSKGSVPGNGLGVYQSKNLHIHVQGNAQDSVGKTAFGGGVYVAKEKGATNEFYGGSVGKCFGYGAQKGALYVQGSADARAGIRLSGADMIIGGDLVRPVPHKEFGNIGVHANIKGFAFEYMTGGRALVMGDPGPWICSGMTGGVLYLRRQEELGFGLNAVKRRLAKGAKVNLGTLSDEGRSDIKELIADYARVLRLNNQELEAEKVESLLHGLDDNFIEVRPVKEQADPSIATE
ncbi:MAG: glutamate synthase-related protein [Turicibacter sp.]|nr:glutamate synthase-related protein [Turicibacter sp.]